MKIDDLFPTQYRAFYRGELSACVERFGGIDKNDLDVLCVKGRGYVITDIACHGYFSVFLSYAMRGVPSAT